MSRELIVNALYANRAYKDVLVLEFTLQLEDVMKGGEGNLGILIDKLNTTRHSDVIAKSNQRRLSTERLKATGRLDILIAVNYMMIAQHGGDFKREEVISSLQTSLSLRINMLSRSHPNHVLRCRDPERLIHTIVFPEAARENSMVA